ncbi:MAG: D-alanyl-D-alanine carboxypeptidase [Rickettsiales bacterium]|nr:D-alanyl-D-alanine carboxypeptidase [Rickettsiales bacterium]
MGLNCEHAILMDFDTGEILYRKKADDIVAPSSTTKIMTAYVIFSMLEEKLFSIDDKFKVSIRAWRQDGTRMFLEPEWKVSVDNLLMGAIVVSGNDAAITLAEGSSGTIANFVKKMNETAKVLNLTNTHFENPTGLYEKTHYVSVYDLAILSRALIKDYGQYYSRYFPQQLFTFNNITQKNRNTLLTEYDGADGIKTGHTEQGKYSMVASVNKKGKRLIAVVARAETEKSRTEDVKTLMNHGFGQYRYLELFKKGDVVGSTNVFLSDKNRVRFYANKDIIYVTKKSEIDGIRVNLVYDKYIFRPVKKNDKIAQLVISDGNSVTKYDLYAEKSVRGIGSFKKFLNLFFYNFKRLILFFRSENAEILEK